MTEHYSFNTIDSLLIQLAITNQELSQKKNELTQQIKVCREDITQRKADIQARTNDVKKLEEEISVRENTVIHNKENVKSMRTTNSLLLQYEQVLRAELDSRKTSYSHDMEEYEERIASYKRKFELYKDCHLENPLVQKLVTLQAEKEEIEGRLKACDDQITIKQKELDRLIGAKQDSCSENTQDSLVEQRDAAQEKLLDCQQEELRDAAINLSSLLLNQTQNDENNSEEQNPQESISSSTTPNSALKEVWSCQQLDKEAVEKQEDGPTQGASCIDGNLEPQVSVTAVQDILKEAEAADEIPTESHQSRDGPAATTSTSPQETDPHSFSAEMMAAPATPSFSFNFSPSSSPQRLDAKSPFFFTMSSNPSTPGFTGFEVETGSSQEEGSVFAFAGSLFNEKKTTETKSSGCPDFLFGQTEQGDDFQFAFPSESPKSADKEERRKDFSFSFNF